MRQSPAPRAPGRCRAPVLSHSGRSAGLTAFVVTMLALVLVAASLIIGRVSGGAEPTPATRSAEAGFARDMQIHHDQAVEMSMIVRDLTDSPDIRLLAYDIATSQSQQAGQMFGWLATWGLPQSSPEPAMTWMHRPLPSGEGHSHAAPATTSEVPAAMPGMATREQLDELKTLRGVAAERMFLQLMIAHHEGGVDMADAVLERSDYPVVTDLAGSITKAQQSEIQLMEDLLAERL
ncbi:uncharacterized protein (DUF305 family) [Leucobacter komagatae]|uniref:Uncharacterized protein (DUF305 family) n=2 Tax=Leucobacter komagatae TaxID=55969 RepID=A0A542Y266_9MICO|nr:uncharacterized protein (DUF305 family) [Leucobacter komagatae]